VVPVTAELFRSSSPKFQQPDGKYTFRIIYLTCESVRES